jgi:hypothetical protein
MQLGPFELTAVLSVSSTMSSEEFLRDLPAVEANLLYLKWQDLYKTEKPFEIFVNIPEGSADRRPTNLVFELGEKQKIRNIRGHENDFHLDTHGFKTCSRPICFDLWEDMNAVTSQYLPEIEQVLREEVEGADEIFVFDWQVSL